MLKVKHNITADQLISAARLEEFRKDKCPIVILEHVWLFKHKQHEETYRYMLQVLDNSIDTKSRKVKYSIIVFESEEVMFEMYSIMYAPLSKQEFKRILSRSSL